MMARKIFDYWKEFLIIALSLVIIKFLFIKVHPQNIVAPEISSSVIKSQALDVAGYLQFDSKEYQIIPSIRTNQGLIAEYQRKYGVEEGNKLVQKNEKPHLWEITWMKNNDFVFGRRERPIEGLRDFIGRLNLTYDMRGNLIGLYHGFSDTSKITSISEEDAKKIVEEFSEKFLDYIKVNTLRISEKTEGEKEKGQIDIRSESQKEAAFEKARIDFTFIANYTDPVSKSDKRISISVTGNKISYIKLLDNNIEFIPLEKNKSIHDIINAVLIIATIILMIVLLFKRYRAFEVGFKQSIKVAFIVAFFIGIEIFISIANEISFTNVFALILAPLFGGIGVMIIWSIADSLGREKWKEKFISTDLLLKGYIRDSRIGNSVIKGLALGFGLNALLLIMYLIFSKIFSLSIIASSSEYLSNSLGAAKLFVGSVASSAYLFMVYVLFSTSYLKGKIKNSLLIPAAGIIFGLIDTGFVLPDYFDILIQSILGMIIIWFFIRNDIFASFIGYASFFFIFHAEPMLFNNSPLYASSVLIIIFLFCIFLLWSIYTILSKDKVLDFDSLTPAYVARITERERLKREFEIAEEVQISLLPSKNPEYKEVEVAARCIPASEVGGDYYDYIEFDKNNLGIVIGDVSGKGIQASFYMALVKGFVKAVAKQTSSPSEILNKLNDLFCENVERGNFITMVFAKINLKEKRFIFARAGHNPVIIKQVKEMKTLFYQPKGFALGMEVSGQFPRYIEEENIQLQTGDLVFLYTDGITEAMNKKKEEFGSDHLKDIIANINSENPKEIIDKIYSEVKSFIGKAPQHDDMTMVVVRIN